MYLGSGVPAYVASRHSDLLVGTVFFLLGSAALAAGIFRARGKTVVRGGTQGLIPAQPAPASGRRPA